MNIPDDVWLTVPEAIGLLAFGIPMSGIELMRAADDRDKFNLIKQAGEKLQEAWAAGRQVIRRENESNPVDPILANRCRIDTFSGMLVREPIAPPMITHEDVAGIRIDLNPRAVNAGYMTSEDSARARRLNVGSGPVVSVERESFAKQFGSTEEQRTSTAAAEMRARRWLADEVKAGDPKRTKEAYGHEAMERFGITRRGFNTRVWCDLPENWRKPGRRVRQP